MRSGACDRRRDAAGQADYRRTVPSTRPRTRNCREASSGADQVVAAAVLTGKDWLPALLQKIRAFVANTLIIVRFSFLPRAPFLLSAKAANNAPKSRSNA